MAHILRGYGLAREQGYFKQEQEADVQRLRQRLVKEGKLPEEAAKAADAAAKAGKPGFQSSEQTYEVLAEVLQQQARLDDPNALRRREFERRIKGEPPPLSEADLLRARSKLHALGAAVGHVPGRISMGRTRWVVPQPGGTEAELAMGVRQLTPEAREVASRTYVAGVRALVYGSLLGAVGLAAAATFAIRAADIRSPEDFAVSMRAGLTPLSASVRSWVLPVRERAQAWLGPTAAPAGEGAALGAGSGSESGVGEGGSGAGRAGSGGGGGAASEFSKRLQQKLNKPRAGTGVSDA